VWKWAGMRGRASGEGDWTREKLRAVPSGGQLKGRLIEGSRRQNSGGDSGQGQYGAVQCGMISGDDLRQGLGPIGTLQH
jgi:hypothetical protein